MTVKLLGNLIHVYMTDDAPACDQRPDRSDYILDGADEFVAVYAMMTTNEVLRFNAGLAVAVGGD